MSIIIIITTFFRRALWLCRCFPCCDFSALRPRPTNCVLCS